MDTENKVVKACGRVGPGWRRDMGGGSRGGGGKRDISNNLNNKDFLKRVSKTERVPTGRRLGGDKEGRGGGE